MQAIQHEDKMKAQLWLQEYDMFCATMSKEAHDHLEGIPPISLGTFMFPDFVFNMQGNHIHYQTQLQTEFPNTT